MGSRPAQLIPLAMLGSEAITCGPWGRQWTNLGRLPVWMGGAGQAGASQSPPLDPSELRALAAVIPFSVPVDNQEASESVGRVLHSSCQVSVQAQRDPDGSV